MGVKKLDTVLNEINIMLQWSYNYFKSQDNKFNIETTIIDYNDLVGLYEYIDSLFETINIIKLLKYSTAFSEELYTFDSYMKEVEFFYTEALTLSINEIDELTHYFKLLNTANKEITFKLFIRIYLIIVVQYCIIEGYLKKNINVYDYLNTLEINILKKLKITEGTKL